MLHRPQPVIRRATRDEIPQIADLIVASLEPFRTAVRARVLDLYIEHSRDVEGRWNSGDVLVIESGGVLAGTVTFVDRLREFGDELPASWARFRSLMVHPDARGQGFGRRLVDHCIETARKQGADAIGLHTGAFMHSARRIYRSVGFLRAPEHDIFASAALGFDPSDGDILVAAYRLDL